LTFSPDEYQMKSFEKMNTLLFKSQPTKNYKDIVYKKNIPIDFKTITYFTCTTKYFVLYQVILTRRSKQNYIAIASKLL